MGTKRGGFSSPRPRNQSEIFWLWFFLWEMANLVQIFLGTQRAGKRVVTLLQKLRIVPDLANVHFFHFFGWQQWNKRTSILRKAALKSSCGNWHSPLTLLILLEQTHPLARVLTQSRPNVFIKRDSYVYLVLEEKRTKLVLREFIGFCKIKCTFFLLAIKTILIVVFKKTSDKLDLLALIFCNKSKILIWSSPKAAQRIFVFTWRKRPFR